ncbi:FecCD family ABC transporter permease [Polymorphum gilvum]|uniref:ABC transporter permease (FecCD_family) protein n=1 Tax=Polymorphum gilvum (strain LMG 25793 / CGMCC 1.9160 / SL003B-26A1) TaxID=991905 RepID=F2IYX5_POLGS|nr:iron ABC transporter permease [Polymorphum gilvum]ADZ70590.1 ABC transporter permease (FecCD_family) protein [Polymorphum gilvum SL003B-26A1]
MMVSAPADGLFAAYRSIALRRTAILVGLGMLTVAAFLADLSAGPADLGLGDILLSLIRPDSLEPRMQIVIWQVRMPDALIALAVGAALGLAGVETQTTLNNPLASPFTLGISSAATLGASFFIVLQPNPGFIGSAFLLPGFAFFFALAAALTILSLASLQGGSTGTVVLYGIALVFLCEALTAGLQYVASDDAIQQIVFWSIGNLTRAGWLEVAVVSAVFLLILPISLRDVWVLTVLRGGEDQARSAGFAIRTIRLLVMLRVSVLAAVAVCFVGTIGFVGLVGPHIARMLLGEDHRFLVPGACLTGAAVLSLASCLSKSVIPGAIVPVGIITAIVGVPVFLALIAIRRGDAGWR